MRFVIPNLSAMRVKLPFCETTQRYEYCESSPATIIMHETNDSGYTLRYVFKVSGRELTVESCTETTASGEQIVAPAGYPYLRLPTSESQPEEWTYMLPDGMLVECIARLDTQEMNGKPCVAIHLSRMFHRRERQKNRPDMIVERYVAGYGIYHRLELSNLKINGKRDIQD